MRGLPTEDAPRRKKPIVVIGGTLIVLLVVLFGTNLFSILKLHLTPVSDDGICTIWDVKRPESYIKNNTIANIIINDEDFRIQSAKTLSGMVQVDTQIYDHPPSVDEDPEYWSKFKKFHEYLEKTFPKTHEVMELTKVNTYGLVYVWKGSDETLKPIMLTGHQDVVPVQKDTLEDWTYPPFEGHFDGISVYGRGAADCKNVVSAIMESVELLINQDFVPQRTIIIALGMDEEVSGMHGARSIGKYLEETFGKDSMYAIIDEGFGLTPDKASGRIVALPGTREKGYIDIVTKLFTPGGHSSMPPDHTSIGIMGELQMLIEKDQYKPIFSKENPTFDYMQCLAKHTGSSMPTKLRKSILRAGFDKLANSYVLSEMVKSKESKYLVQTSQAMDLVNGGEKINALPESVKLVTNHRIAIESSVRDVYEHFLQRVIQIGKKHGLGVESGNITIIPSSGNGKFVVSDFGNSLEVAPRTPIDDNVWKNLAGVTRHIYEDLVYPDLKEPVIVAPAIMTGNTDTRHYWNLTKNIFRYTPFVSYNFAEQFHVHSVDEMIDIENHLRVVAFFYEYLQVVDSKQADN